MWPCIYKCDSQILLPFLSTSFGFVTNTTGAGPACLTWQSAAKMGRERERRMGSAATTTLVKTTWHQGFCAQEMQLAMQKNSICSFFWVICVSTHNCLGNAAYCVTSCISKCTCVFNCTVQPFNGLNLMQRSGKSSTNAVYCRVEKCRLFMFEWNTRSISHGKKKAHMGCTIPVYNIDFVLWPLLGTEPCNVVWILITMCVWIV